MSRKKVYSRHDIVNIFNALISRHNSAEDAYADFSERDDIDYELFERYWKSSIRRVEHDLLEYLEAFSKTFHSAETRTISSDYLSDDDLSLQEVIDAGHLVVTAPLGAGKTTHLLKLASDFINKCKSEGTTGVVMFILPRKLLATQIYEKASRNMNAFLRLGSESKQGSQEGPPSLVVCNYEGLYYHLNDIIDLFKNESNLKFWFIWDECHALETDTFRAHVNRRVLLAFRRLCADFLVQNSIPYITTWVTATPRPSLINILQRVAPPGGGNSRVWDGAELFSVISFVYPEDTAHIKDVTILQATQPHAALCRLLKVILSEPEHPKIYVSSCNFEVNANLYAYLKSHLQDTNIVDLNTHTADTDFKNADILIATSVIDSGYSIEPDRDSLVIVVGGKRIGWVEVFQRLSRFRKRPNCNIQYLWIYNPHSAPATQPQFVDFDVAYQFPLNGDTKDGHQVRMTRSGVEIAKAFNTLDAELECWFLRIACVHGVQSNLFSILNEHFTKFYGCRVTQILDPLPVSRDDKDIYQFAYSHLAEVTKYFDFLTATEKAASVLQAVVELTDFEMLPYFQDIEVDKKLVECARDFIIAVDTDSSLSYTLYRDMTHFLFLHTMLDPLSIDALHIPRNLESWLTITPHARSRYRSMISTFLLYVGYVFGGNVPYEIEAAALGIRFTSRDVLASAIVSNYLHELLAPIRFNEKPDYNFTEYRDEVFIPFLFEKQKELKGITHPDFVARLCACLRVPVALSRLTHQDVLGLWSRVRWLLLLHVYAERRGKYMYFTRVRDCPSQLLAIFERAFQLLDKVPIKRGEISFHECLRRTLMEFVPSHKFATIKKEDLNTAVAIVTAVPDEDCSRFFRQYARGVPREHPLTYGRRAIVCKYTLMALCNNAIVSALKEELFPYDQFVHTRFRDLPLHVQECIKQVMTDRQFAPYFVYDGVYRDALSPNGSPVIDFGPLLEKFDHESYFASIEDETVGQVIDNFIVELLRRAPRRDMQEEEAVSAALMDDEYHDARRSVWFFSCVGGLNGTPPWQAYRPECWGKIRQAFVKSYRMLVEFARKDPDYDTPTEFHFSFPRDIKKIGPSPRRKDTGHIVTSLLAYSVEADGEEPLPFFGSSSTPPLTLRFNFVPEYVPMERMIDGLLPAPRKISAWERQYFGLSDITTNTTRRSLVQFM